MKQFLTILALSLLAGCQQADLNPEFNELNQQLKKAGAKSTAAIPYEGLSPEEVEKILQDGLTREEAVSLALVNNGELHEEFLQLGVEKTEQVQSYLLSNPTFDLSILLPEGGGRSNLAMSLAQNIAELWRLPLKKEISEKKVKASLYKIVSIARVKKLEVEQIYNELLSLDVKEKSMSAALTLREKMQQALVKKMEVGAASREDVIIAEGALFKMQLEFKGLQVEKIDLMNELKTGLGIRHDQQVKLSDSLKYVKAEKYSREAIEKSLKNDPALVSLALEIEAAEKEYGIEKNSVFKRVELGFARERLERRGGDGPGINVIQGPLLSVELPVFDQNQVMAANKKFIYLSKIKRFENQYLKNFNEIYVLMEKIDLLEEQIKLFETKLKPQTVRRLQISEKAYADKNITLIQYLRVKEETFELNEKYRELLLNYLRAQKSLENYISKEER